MAQAQPRYRCSGRHLSARKSTALNLVTLGAQGFEGARSALVAHAGEAPSRGLDRAGKAVHRAMGYGARATSLARPPEDGSAAMARLGRFVAFRHALLARSMDPSAVECHLHWFVAAMLRAGVPGVLTLALLLSATERRVASLKGQRRTRYWKLAGEQIVHVPSVG